jgi:hypothetical protein
VIASLLYTAVAHACSELHGTQVFLQAAWDHGASRGESPDNAENDNCESIRFALLSTPASFFQAGLLAVHSIAVAHAPLASVAPPDLLSIMAIAKSSFPQTWCIAAFLSHSPAYLNTQYPR